LVRGILLEFFGRVPLIRVHEDSGRGVPPLVVSASAPTTTDTLAGLIREDNARWLRLLWRHGALLFRGFDMVSADDLARVFAAAGGMPMAYLGGISPRRRVGASVYSATDLPPGVRIPLHNELSYLAVYPRALWFACQMPAERGGETTLADGRAVYRRLDAAVRERFVARGVRYACSFHGPSVWSDLLERFQKVTKSWMETFDTDERRAVEERCREIGAEPRWLASGRLVLETRRPAVVDHPVTGERAWFNSAHLFRLHPRGIGWARYVLSRVYAPRRQRRTHDAWYGDGGEIDGETLEHLFDALDASTVAVRWQRGDLLWVDNLLCMHGRNPYHGERRVLAALTR
jgi:alpha-ketoglutarate-dependent taurine dioxygenase